MNILVFFGVFFLNLPGWGAFNINSDGTVTDTVTQLIWDQCPFGFSGADCAIEKVGHFSWNDALLQVQNARSKHY